MSAPRPREGARVVLVTGGGRGIGRAIVHRFAQRGARVLICDTDHFESAVNHYRSTSTSGFEAARELASELREQGHWARALQADVTVPEQVEALQRSVREIAGGELGAVVNAVGSSHVSKVEEMSLESWNSIVSTNLTSVFLVSQAAIPLLRESGGGAIVNVSSIAGRTGFAKVAHYCAAKAGVIGFSSSLALELADSGIRVNVVCPGIVRTDLWEYLLDEFTRPGETRDECWQRMVDGIPQKRAQTPEDIAEAVVFLAESPQITGQVLSVDGGMFSGG